MTEKRFKLSEPNGAYLIDDDKVYAHWINDDDKIIDLLNEQHETIQVLKASNGEMEDYLARLEEENKQLKSDLRYWRTLAQSLAKKNNVGDFE